jgi:putative SOS response-associated peptidase YedK
MCNNFGNHIAYSDYLAAFSQTRIPIKWPTFAPNLEPREDIWPTDKATVIRRLEDGTNEFVELRWSFPPARPKGAPADGGVAPIRMVGMAGEVRK